MLAPTADRDVLLPLRGGVGVVEREMPHMTHAAFCSEESIESLDERRQLSPKHSGIFLFGLKLPVLIHKNMSE